MSAPGVDFSDPAFDPTALRRRNLALASGIISPPGAPMPGSPSAQDIATDQAAEAGAQPAPAAAPTPADLVVMLKDKGTRAALSSNSSTTTKVSKESKAAGAAEVAAIAAEKPIADQQQEIGEDNAQARQDAANGDVLAIQQQQRDQAALAAVHDEIRAKKQAALDDAIQAHAAATPGDFWASQPDGAQVHGAIAVALGQLGAGLQSMGGGNGHNAALDILNRRQDQFYALQKEKLDHTKDNVLMARAGVKDADEARQIAQTTLGAKYILGLEATKAQLAQGLAAQGKSQAEVDAALKKAGLDEKIAALRVQLTTPTNTQVTSSFNGTAALGALDGAVKAGQAKAKAGGSLDFFDPETGEKLGSARTTRDLGVASKTLEATNVVKGDVKNLRDFYAANQGRIFSPEKRETLESLRNTLTGHILTMNNQSGSDFKIKFDAGMVPHAGDILQMNQNATPKLDILDNEIAHIRDTTLRARGITGSPSESSAVGNPTGAPASTAASGPPPGSQRGTYRGKAGYLTADGVFHADGE